MVFSGGLQRTSAHRQPLAHQEREFQTLRTRESLKFSSIYLGTLALYIIVYQLIDAGNSLPIVCAGINACFAICAIGCHFCRCDGRAPVIFHALGLFILSLFAAICHPEVQYYFHHNTALLQPFGAPPRCAEYLYALGNNRCRMVKDSYESIMLLQFAMTYHIIFLLSFRAAVISCIPSFILYTAVTGILGSSFLMKTVLKYVILVASLVIALIAKFTIESSQRLFFSEVQTQRMNAVREKVLRCQAEFRSEHLQEGLSSSVQKGDGTLSNKSDGAPSSAGCFATMDEGSDPKDTLQKIRAIGHQEHWLLDINRITVYRNQVLGCGGYGVVMKGNFDRTSVALKLSKPKCGNQSMPSLLNELRILRRLRHPNIVLFHGASVEFSKSQLVLVIEFVCGETLHAWIQNPSKDSQSRMCRPQKTERAKQIALLGVSSALSYLHGQSPCIVHGDIKASNIMIEDLANQPRAKLLDFGLSRLLTPNARHLGGTLRWMAPEVAKGRCHPTSASDVFSFGRLVYFIATEQMPFADYEKHILRRILDKQHSHSLIWPNTSNRFSEACRLIGEASTHHRPEMRPQAIEVHDEIIGWSSILLDQAGHVRNEQDDGESIGLYEYLQQLSKHKPWTRQSKSTGSQPNVLPRGADTGALPQIPEGNVCDGVADDVAVVAGTGRDAAHGDLNIGKLKPTPLRTKLITLSEVMAEWHDAPCSGVCCSWHNSVHGLEQVVRVLHQRSCLNDWDLSSNAYQCPGCLLIINQDSGVCPFCKFAACSIGTLGVPAVNDVSEDVSQPLSTSHKRFTL